MVFNGMAVGTGVAIGVIYRHDSRSNVHVSEQTIPASKVRSEQHRLLEAAARAAAEVGKIQTEAKRKSGAAGEEIGYLLDAYQQMLSGSRLIRGVQKRIDTDQINAEAAVMREIGLMVEAFATMEDKYLAARVDDVREVGRRLVESLTGKKTRALANLPKNAVIVADELSPADTATLDPQHVLGLVTLVGGVESHTAIVARALGLPAVVSDEAVLDAAGNGQHIIVDGTNGIVIINPSAKSLATYRKRKAEILREQKSLRKLTSVRAVTNRWRCY